MNKHYKSSEVTRKAICDALKRLMAQKPLSKITISDIMSECGMRRQHFYYYFSDLYDLVRYAFEDEALNLRHRQDGALAWQDGLLQLFRYIAENRAVCLCALDSLGREYLKQLFETDINGIVCHAVEQVIRENSFPQNEAKTDLTSRFLTIATAGIVESWLRGEIRQTPEELIALFTTMFQDYITGVSVRLAGLTAAPQSTEGGTPWEITSLH